ncbi:MAG: flagellar basal body P-ring formation protein FlgA [Magnetococcales bacterium]|nr:flagellar basal body P-ring formation protein FlgA [Magnetococcales bacterium]
MKRTIAHLILTLGMVLWAIPGNTTTMSRHTIADQISNAINTQLQQSGSNYSLTSLVVAQDLNIDGKNIVWEPELSPERMRLGRQIVRVKLVVDGFIKGTVQATAMIRKQLLVPLLRSRVARGTVIHSSDIEWREMEVRRDIPGMANDEAQLVGKASTRVIRAGVPLQASWFSEPILVERGERVLVHVRTGGLNIKAVGISMGKGRMGETITLRNPKSQRRFMARVISAGKAEVVDL